jgi:hypothetical protein
MNWDIFIPNFLCASRTDRSSVYVPRPDISHYAAQMEPRTLEPWAEGPGVNLRPKHIRSRFRVKNGHYHRGCHDRDPWA